MLLIIKNLLLQSYRKNNFICRVRLKTCGICQNSIEPHTVEIKVKRELNFGVFKSARVDLSVYTFALLRNSAPLNFFRNHIFSKNQ